MFDERAKLSLTFFPYLPSHHSVFVLQAKQNTDSYALYLKHIQSSAYEIATEGNLKYKNKLYSISSLVSLKEKREINVELHVDR